MGVLYQPYLRNASTTMKMTLSNTAGAACSSPPSKVASPGINGLYGKNPEEKVSMPTGTNRLAITVAQLRKPAIVPICCFKAVNTDAKELNNSESKGHNCPKGGRIVFTIDGYPHTAFSSSVQSVCPTYINAISSKLSMKGKVHHEAQTMKHMYVDRRCNHQ